MTPTKDVLALAPDGVFLSNGPGDPAACGYAVETCQEVLDRHIPLFGICLGQQVLGITLGGRTVKRKTGPHGANQPGQDLDRGRGVITSQNHGYTVEGDSLPAKARASPG